MQTAERVSQHDVSDNYVFQRSVLAYHKAAEMVSGRVLEIGTGAGYGIEIVALKTEAFLTLDKTPPPAEIYEGKPNVTFKQIQVPPLTEIESESFDFVISFQVIEHIKNDTLAIAEINRVLKNGGKLIISTPNKEMSLTRNPWHVREYTPQQFATLLGGVFAKVEPLGVFGNEKVMAYYENNRRSVKAVMKYDILRLNRWLPRRILQIPYDIMNRRNRKKLLKSNTELTASIKMDDYYIADIRINGSKNSKGSAEVIENKNDNGCFDLFYIAEKQG